MSWTLATFTLIGLLTGFNISGFMYTRRSMADRSRRLAVRVQGLESQLRLGRTFQVNVETSIDTLFRRTEVLQSQLRDWIIAETDDDGVPIDLWAPAHVSRETTPLPMPPTLDVIEIPDKPAATAAMYTVGSDGYEAPATSIFHIGAKEMRTLGDRRQGEVLLPRVNRGRRASDQNVAVTFDGR